MMQPSKTAEPITGYFLRERIGVGGYGEVWSAQAPGDLSKAIKFVYGHFDDERAARELKALNRIKEVRHPFLLSLERFEIIDGQLLIVTELADMSLKDRAHQAKAVGGSIPREELLGYLRDAADALDYMSERFSLQHLDVKPENLLLIGGRVKVADFGLVKELHDVASSLMGGLTPVYASPEVFDGLPSPHSDQYSLAIVYQEMLTAVLPFAGRTAAQLASQHLHASPRLTPLPEKDQPIIARALSKDPSQRFPSCRALVDALLNADRSVQGQQFSADPGTIPRVESTSATSSIRSRAAETNIDWQRAPRPADAPPLQSPTIKTQVIGSADVGTWAGESLARKPQVVAPKEAVSLPPLEKIPLDVELRPSLFLGIGGTAGRTLTQLRRLLGDRFGPDVSVPAMQMLLLDTDVKELNKTADSDWEAAAIDIETLALPLRSAHEYTTDSRDLLHWLSRRWLYNIPRSLQTEGRRPLGRLALVDHAQQVLARLRKSLIEITSGKAVAASAEATGLRFGSAPRIFLISSISGGTGSGMVLDVAYAVRTLLTELGQSDEGLCGILTHSTDRNHATGDLSIANAYACLSELHHYSVARSYPGEATCGLPAFEPGSGTFGHAYFVDLGHNLTDDDFRQATNSLASFIYLNTVGGPSGAFDECRLSTTREAARTSLRSFGLSCIGASHSALPQTATTLVCEEVLDRWRGAGRRASEMPVPAGATTNELNGQISPTQVEQLAAEHAAAAELDFERLRARVMALVEKELGGNAKANFAKIRATTSRPLQGASKQTGYVPRTLQAISNQFGLELTHDELRRAAPSSLRVALEQSLGELSASTSKTVREWLLNLVERTDVRVGGAGRAKDWYSRHLRSIEAQGTQQLREAQQRIGAFEEVLQNLEQAPGLFAALFGTRRVNKPTAEKDAALLGIMQLRFEETALRAMCKMLRVVVAQLASVGDQINDLQRELGRLSELSDKRGAAAEAQTDSTNCETVNAVRLAVSAAIRERAPGLAQVVDERFQAEFLQVHGGLLGIVQNADASRAALLAALHASAQSEVVRALKDISVAPRLLGNDVPDIQAARLRACVDSAKSRLTNCGGAGRLLAILPQGTGNSTLEELLLKQSDPRPTLIADSDADLVLCHEMQELSIPLVAHALTAQRNDFAQIAARLHTRTDIEWSDLAEVDSLSAADCAAN